MKKRRELNALVGREKIRRKSTSTSGSLELLRYNGSESSDDDFRMSSSKTRGSSICSSCTAVLVVLLLVACMLVCAGLTWMHVEMKKDLQILQQSLAAVEGKSLSSSDDVQQLFQQLSVFNKTAMQQGKTFSQLQTNISSVNDTFNKLSAIVNTLGRGLEAAPELKELPAKLVAVSKALAALGSNVSGLKETVDLFSPSMKSAQTKLEALSTELAGLNQNTGTLTSSPQTSPDVANIVRQLTEQIQGINSTVSSQLSVLMKSATIYGEKIFQLENRSQNLSNLIESIGSAHKLLNAVHAPVSEDYTSELFQSSVKGIVENKTINPLDIEGSVTMEMLKTFEDGLKMKVETLNISLVQLKYTVSHMADLLVKQATQVTYMTKQIEASQHYIVQIESKLDNKVEVAYSTTIKPTLDSQVPMSGSLTTSSSLPADMVQSTSSTKTILIPSIKSMQDLDINFHRWNLGNDGEVKYSVLPDFLGPDTPNEEDLKQFDEDHNGQYSLQEFTKALGIAVEFEVVRFCAFMYEIHSSTCTRLIIGSTFTKALKHVACHHYHHSAAEQLTTTFLHPLLSWARLAIWAGSNVTSSSSL